MQIVIHPVDVDVTEGLRAYINDRLNKYFKKHSYITNIEVYVKMEEERHEDTHIIETIIHLPGPEMYADAAAKSYDIALNETIDKLRRQMEKYKEKHHSHRA